MEQIVQTLAESSPIAVVSVVAIWRISAVMMTLVNAFVLITTAQSDTVGELVDKAT